jgi:hypothetical protein
MRKNGNRLPVASLVRPRPPCWKCPKMGLGSFGMAGLLLDGTSGRASPGCETGMQRGGGSGHKKHQTNPIWHSTFRFQRTSGFRNEPDFRPRKSQMAVFGGGMPADRAEFASTTP